MLIILVFPSYFKIKYCITSNWLFNFSHHLLSSLYYHLSLLLPSQYTFIIILIRLILCLYYFCGYVSQSKVFTFPAAQVCVCFGVNTHLVSSVLSRESTIDSLSFLRLLLFWNISYQFRLSEEILNDCVLCLVFSFHHGILLCCHPRIPFLFLPCWISFILLCLSLYCFILLFSGKEPTSKCRRCKRRRFNPWVGKIPWRRAWQPTPVFLPGESHGRRSLVGYSPWDCKELDTTEVT